MQEAGLSLTRIPHSCSISLAVTRFKRTKRKKISKTKLKLRASCEDQGHNKRWRNNRERILYVAALQ
jgi:hypothetical protein